MEIYARQGDIVIDRLPAKLKDEDFVERTNVVLAGHGSGHRHTIIGKVLVAPPLNDGHTRFRITRLTQIEHAKPDGHVTTEIVPGDYEARPLRERGGAGDRSVID